MECGFSDIFLRHICFTVAETIGVTNYAASIGAKYDQKTTFEAAEMILGPWNQQITNQTAFNKEIRDRFLNFNGSLFSGAGTFPNWKPKITFT